MQGLSELSQSLSELEVTEQMLSEAEALSNMAEEESQSLGEGMCKGGNCQNPGANSGQQGSQSPSVADASQNRSGRGRAAGGNTGKSKTPTGTKAKKAQSKNAGGDIIARQLIENPNPEIGESVIPAESIGEAIDGGAGSSVGDDQMMQHLNETYKTYFGRLRREAAGSGTSAAPAPGGSSPAPTGGAAPTPASK